MITRTVVFVSCVGVMLAVGVTASEAQRQRQQTVSGAITQPFRDLGFNRERPPEILSHAATVPYEIPAALEGGAPNCPAMISEIEALDEVLGPDMDAPPPPRRLINGQSLIAGAIRSAMHIPYRSVVRRLSGAEHREQVMNNAIQAGMVRRAFLKGLRMRDCAPQTQMVSAEQAAPAGDPALVQTLVGTDSDAVEAPAQTIAIADPVPAPAAPAGTQTLVASEPQAVTQTVAATTAEQGVASSQ